MEKGFIDPSISKKDRSRYQKWIDNHVPDGCKGKCRHYADEMVKVFKELRVVGIVGFGLIGSHAWCLTPDNKVVDPTYHQFGSYFHQEDPLEISEFPLYKCMNCGELVWPDTPRTRLWAGEDGVGPHDYCEEILMKEFG